MAKLAGVQHLHAIKTLEKAGFTIVRQGKKHVVMSQALPYDSSKQPH
jgi:predicted RNA binding protein YcfA (HicA-like mRNA interferase family)